MKTPTAFIAILLTILLMEVDSASAQNRNTLGAGQQNQLGGVGLGGLGQGGLGQNAFGAGRQPGLGQQGLGNRQQSRIGGAGQSRFGQNAGLAGNQNQPLVGGGDGFVGSDAEQVRNLRRNLDPRQGQRAQFDFAIESLNEMRESQRQGDSQRNQAPAVRVQLRPLFAVARPSSAALASDVTDTFDKAMPNSGAAAQVSIDGNTATIQGTAASDYDKQLAAKLLSLQPGISEVNNQLTVEPGPEVSSQDELRLSPSR